MTKIEEDNKIWNFLDSLSTALLKSNIPPKISKAVRMYKKEKNLLYIDNAEQSLKAVVKSQTQPNKLEYACCLNDDGTYFCGTQNLYSCGGLRGSICKHIILSLIATVKEGLMTKSQLIDWVKKSVDIKPKFNKPEATKIFLKYKDALDGKIEWRPIEVYPEDFMAF